MTEHTEQLTQRVQQLQHENEAQHRRVRVLSAERQRLETQVSNLARLCSASIRLREAQTDSELMATFEEIIKDLIGSEAFAVFELEADASALSLRGCMGVDPELLRRVPLQDSPLARVVQQARRWVCDTPSADALALSACIPLKVGPRVLGVIAIFRLLPHKACLEAADHVLFDMLETQGGMALHCVRCPTVKPPLAGGS